MARPKRQHERAIPDHPYRDAAVVYGIMALLLVGIAGLTGGSIVRACLAALTFFLLATAWSWWKFRGRIREREAAAAALAGGVSESGGVVGDGGEPE